MAGTSEAVGSGVEAGPSARRIEALDVVRGVALLGILLMNIVGMGLGPAYNDPIVAGGAEGVNLWTWIVTNIAFEGTQRALFSMLFGAGVILFTARLEAAGRPDAADIYFRRNLWLIGFGMVNAWVLLFVGDILFTYGITALFLYAFRKLAGRTLLAIGLAALLANAAWGGLETWNMLGVHEAHAEASAVPEASRTPEQKRAIEAWQQEEAEFRPPPQAVPGMRAELTRSYWSALKLLAPIIVQFQSSDLYRYFFDIFGMMMLGMALYRLGVLTLEVRTRVYVAMLLLGYAIGLAVNVAETRWIIDNGFSPLAFTQTKVTYDLGRLAMTLGHLGLIMLFIRSGMLSFLRRALAAVGRMAFTNYILHSVMALVVFILLGWWGAFERHELYYLVFATWAVQLVLSPIWLRHFRFGPLEWLWRYLTYGERPPFRRSGAA